MIFENEDELFLHDIEEEQEEEEDEDFMTVQPQMELVQSDASSPYFVYGSGLYSEGLLRLVELDRNYNMALFWGKK